MWLDYLLAHTPLAFFLNIWKSVPLLSSLITADTLSTSVDYVVKGYIPQDEIPIVDRYLYYGILGTGYFFTRFVLWNVTFEPLLRIGFLLLSTPSLMGKLTRQGIFPLAKVKKKLVKILKRVLCEQLTRVVNHVVNRLLKLKMIVYHQDIGHLIDNATPDSVKAFLKAVLLGSITHAVESSYTLIKYFNQVYNWNFRQSESSQRVILKRILYTRDWIKLSDPATIRLFIHLYDPDSESMGIFLSTLYEASMKFLCAVSIASFLGGLGSNVSQLILSFISTLFYYRVCKRNKCEFVFSYVRLIGLVLGCQTGLYVLHAFLCEFNEMLRLDKAFSSLAKITRQEVVPKNFNPVFFYFPVALVCLRLVFGATLTALILGVIVMPNKVQGITFTTWRLTAVYLFGWLSGYALVHLMVMSCFLGLLERPEDNPNKFIEEIEIINDYSPAREVRIDN